MGLQHVAQARARLGKIKDLTTICRVCVFVHAATAAYTFANPLMVPLVYTTGTTTSVRAHARWNLTSFSLVRLRALPCVMSVCVYHRDTARHGEVVVVAGRGAVLISILALCMSLHVHGHDAKQRNLYVLCGVAGCVCWCMLVWCCVYVLGNYLK